MFDLITEFIQTLIESTISTFNFSILTSAKTVFLVEDEISDVLSVAGIKVINDYIFEFALTLLTIKFLLKGFRAYVAYTEGDAQASPSFILTRYIKALVIMLTFTELYSFFVDVSLEVISKVLKILSNQIAVHIGSDFRTIIKMLLTTTFSSGGVILIFVLIYIVLYFIIMIRYMRAGLEMLILRIGITFACINILDTEQEVFKTYIKKFINIFFTTLVTLSLLTLSLGFLINAHIIWAIACISLALISPRFVQEFMLVTRGEGGAMTKAYYSSNMVRSIFKMFRKGA